MFSRWLFGSKAREVNSHVEMISNLSSLSMHNIINKICPENLPSAEELEQKYPKIDLPKGAHDIVELCDSVMRLVFEKQNATIHP